MNPAGYPDSCINSVCIPISIADIQDEIHSGVVILEFTDSEVLAPSCRSAVLRRDRGHEAVYALQGAPAAGFMQ